MIDIALRERIVRLVIETLARAGTRAPDAGAIAYAGLADTFGASRGLERAFVKSVADVAGGEPGRDIPAFAAHLTRSRHADPAILERDVETLSDRLGIRDPDGIRRALVSPGAPDAVLAALQVLSAGFEDEEALDLLARMGHRPESSPEGYVLSANRADEGPYGMYFVSAPFRLSDVVTAPSPGPAP